MNKSVVITVLIVGVIGLVAGGIILSGSSEDSSTESKQESTSQQSQQPNDEQSATQSDKSFDIAMKNFEFSMNEISAAPGETITVNLTTDGGGHDFVIDELNVQSETLSGSSTDSVTFTVPEDAAGKTLAFYCSIGNHRSQGMEGQLVISQ